ncbi:hypothetical protein BY996DRAFT_8543004 [Phakopsora pachyrhizi]|nr:hypothetical protein BY996DRAFT_8543004 [Phakopsora pachyrhizi]
MSSSTQSYFHPTLKLASIPLKQIRLTNHAQLKTTLNKVKTLHQLRSQRTSHLPLGNLKRSFTSFSVRLPKSLTDLSYDTEDSKYHTDSAGSTQKAFNPKINGNENQIRRLAVEIQRGELDNQSLYPSETNGQITFGNHALDLSQLQPAPESESVLDWGRLFTLQSPFDQEDPQLLKEGQVRHHYNYIYFPKDYLNRTWSTNSKRRGKSKNQIYLLVELIQNATEQWKLKVSRQSKDLKGVFPVIFSTRSIQQSLHLTLPNPSDLWGFDALFSTYIARLIKKRKVSIDLTKGIVDFIRAYSNGIGGEVLDNLISWVDDWEGDLKEWFNWSERNLVKINTTATNNVKGEMMLKEDYIRFDSAKAIASELTLEI